MTEPGHSAQQAAASTGTPRARAQAREAALDTLAGRLAARLARDEAFIDRLAAAVALGVASASLAPAAQCRLLSVGEVAEMAGRSTDWVRDHRDELGLVTVGDGPRPRLMFDAQAVLDRLSVGSSGVRSPPPEDGAATPLPRGRRRRPSGASVDLLPIGGRQPSREAA